MIKRKSYLRQSLHLKARALDNSNNIINNNPLISTAFKSTDKGINAWIEKGSAKRLSNNPIASLEDKSSVSDVILGQNPTDIINYIKEKLNPNVTKHKILRNSCIIKN